MRFAYLFAATLGMAAISFSQSQAQETATRDTSRNGPFVATDATLGSLLAQDFEIKGILGGGLILVKEAALYNCALAPDHEALSYKTQFECSVLDEIPTAQSDK